MWFSIYLLSVAVFVAGSVVALYHCVRYGRPWDKTRLAAFLYVIVSSVLLAISAVLALSIFI